MYRDLIITSVLIIMVLIMRLTLVSANPGITIDVTSVNSQVAPTENATYSVYIKSDSTELENVTLSIANPTNGWNYSFSRNDFSLPAYSDTIVEFNITVPKGTTNGDYSNDVQADAVAIDPDFGPLPDHTSYNNVITTVLSTPASIPEFPTIVLPVISALGIMLLIQRRI